MAKQRARRRLRRRCGVPRARVAIEVDGWAFHSDHEAFQNDRHRQNRLALRGWQVLRFTWLDLTEYPERVIATIQAAIRVSLVNASVTNDAEIAG